MSNYIIPLMIFIVVIYGMIKRIDVFNAFVDGSLESFKLITKIFPNLLAMIFSVNVLISSGFIESFINLFASFLKLPLEIVSLALVRPISGNASLAILNNIFAKYGVDSFYGILSSVIQGSTDTTFYILALYYGSVGIKNLKYAPYTSLFADAVGIMSALLICHLLF